MGRKKNVIAPEAKAMDLVAKKHKEEELSIQQIEETYGDGQAYERLRLENEIRFYQQQMGDSLIETGKRLIRIKVNEEHGGFLKTLENLGMADRSANYAMAAARKFSNSQSIANLGNTKIMALSVLDDEDIQALSDGKEAAGMTLDEIDRMTTRELRENLRKEREKRKKEKHIQESAIGKKEEKINELEQQLRYQEPPTKEKLAQTALDAIDKKYFPAIAEAVYAIDKCRLLILDAQKIEGIDYHQLNDWMLKNDENIRELQTTINELWETIDDIHADKGDE